MRKYFTWRCIGLHTLVLVLVPAFLLAGWWQYNVARGGNDLSWLYTVEWPFFALYAIYAWWKLIHDKSTGLDRLWAAKQRAAADASGTPIYQIPGWATDKELSRAVRKAAVEATGRPALAQARPDALESKDQKLVREQQGSLQLSDERSEGRGDVASRDRVIDAQVLEVKVIVDEELDAYNRYLFELSLEDPPKRWTSSRRRSRSGGAQGQDEPRGGASQAPQLPRRPELPRGAADGEQA